MVKISSGDALAVLRRFKVAGDEHTPRHIEQLSVTNPTQVSTLAGFRFQKKQYYVLFDDTAEDDIAYVVDQIVRDGQNLTGEVLQNPNDHITTYALPFKGKDVYVFAETSNKIRLDQEIARRYPEQSRSTWQKYIKAGYVRVNDELATSPKQDITAADTIAVELPAVTNYEDNVLPILYIDDDVIVINKPAGVLTHAKGVMNDEFTVADFFRRYTNWGLDTNRPGIIHRLDRETSGVLIGARNQQVAELLQKQFAKRTVKKQYLAIVSGTPKHDKATIDVPILRNQAAPSTFKVDASGKLAQTTYEVMAHDNDSSLVLLQPRTGRTHQLRVHMKHIGTPILGDKVYGNGSPAERMYLHAYSLEITIPTSKRMVFTAEAPESFSAKFAGAANV